MPVSQESRLSFSTIAPSYVQAHNDEFASFESFVALYPNTTLLVDTYDTLDGMCEVISLSRKLGNKCRVRAVRLDSGDLGDLARRARQMLIVAFLALFGRRPPVCGLWFNYSAGQRHREIRNEWLFAAPDGAEGVR